MGPKAAGRDTDSVQRPDPTCTQIDHSLGLPMSDRFLRSTAEEAEEAGKTGSTAPTFPERSGDRACYRRLAYRSIGNLDWQVGV